jgi:CHAD domain-containing protein
MSANRDISISLKEIITGQLNNLLLQIRNNNQSPEILVHEVRKGIKRIRSLFRLFKPAISEYDFHIINELIADAGRSLTLHREAVVNYQTYKEIERSINDSISTSAKVIINQYLSKEVKEAYSNIGNAFNNQILNVSFQLSKIRDKIDSLNVRNYSHDLFILALEKNYQKTIHYFSICRISLHLEAIHKWRKFCKHVFFQVRFGPLPENEESNKFAEQLNILSEILGKEHDLAVLNLHFIKHIYKDIEAKDRTILLQYFDRERTNFQKKAFWHGREIFSKEIPFMQPEYIFS